MRKILLSTFLVLLSFNLLSQVKFGKIKCDSFQVLLDTNRALIFRKNKCTVYDKSVKKSLIRPTTDGLVYLEEQDAFIKISADRFTLLYIGEENRSYSVSNENPNWSEMKFSNVEDKRLDDIVFFNGTYLNYKTGEILEDKKLIDEFYAHNQLNLVRNQDGTICFNYWKQPLVGSVDADHAELVDAGFNKSGVYRLNDRKWIVPQVYENCTAIEDKFICLKRNAIIPVMTAAYEPWYDNTYSYTFYKNKGGVFKPIQNDIQSDEELDYNVFFEVDSMTKIKSDPFFITYKNKEQGLVKFQLFSPDGSNNPKLVYQKIKDPVHDFVLLNNDYGFFLTFDQGEVKPIHFYSFVKGEVDPIELGDAEKAFYWGADDSGGVSVCADNETFIWPEFIKPDSLRESIINESKIEFKNMNLWCATCAGIELLNDSLLLIMDYKNDSVDPFAEPLKSMEYPEEDSIYYNEEEDMWYAAYPPDFPGYERSGIYNYRRTRWRIQPIERTIEVAGNGILINTFERDINDGSTIWTDRFSLQNNSEYSFENWNFETKNPSIDHVTKELFEVINPNQILEFPENSIYRENNGYREAHYSYEGAFFYVQDEIGKWAIYRPVFLTRYLTLKPFSKTKEFVHYNPSFNYFVWLENDSIYFEKGIYSATVSQKYGKISVDFINSYDGDELKIQAFEGADTNTIKTSMFESIEGMHSYASYELSNGKFLLNEELNYDNIDRYFSDLEDSFMGFDNDITYRNFQSETSSIWQKEQGAWVKKTPYYAMVKPLPFGYLVHTGGSEELLDAFTGESNAIPENYIVLDSNFKALSYFDFYNFELARIRDYGLELCDAKGCFMISNGGEIMTTSGWSDFELEDGRIKAIKYKDVPDEDFWLYDVDELIEKEEYFDLK